MHDTDEPLDRSDQFVAVVKKPKGCIIPDDTGLSIQKQVDLVVQVELKSERNRQCQQRGHHNHQFDPRKFAAVTKQMKRQQTDGYQPDQVEALGHHLGHEAEVSRIIQHLVRNPQSNCRVKREASHPQRPSQDGEDSDYISGNVHRPGKSVVAL